MFRQITCQLFQMLFYIVGIPLFLVVFIAFFDGFPKQKFSFLLLAHFYFSRNFLIWRNFYIAFFHFLSDEFFAFLLAFLFTRKFLCHFSPCSSYFPVMNDLFLSFIFNIPKLIGQIILIDKKPFHRSFFLKIKLNFYSLYIRTYGF